MSRYDPTTHSVRPAQVVSWATGVLLASAALAQGFPSGEATIYEGTEPATTPDRYGTVMQERSAGGTLATLDGRRVVRFMVKYECDSEITGWETWHQEMHDRTAEELVGRVPRLESADALRAVRLTQEADMPMLDAQDHVRYSAQAYSVPFRGRT
jgi:hypothetical protein